MACRYRWPWANPPFARSQPMAEYQWTPDAVETVKTLLVDQHQNQRQVANHFGVSVRAVAGVVARHHLQGLNVHRDVAKPKPAGRRPR